MSIDVSLVTSKTRTKLASGNLEDSNMYLVIGLIAEPYAHYHFDEGPGAPETWEVQYSDINQKEILDSDLDNQEKKYMESLLIKINQYQEDLKVESF